MDLLSFARGPGMEWAITIFVVGILWRLTGLLFLKHKLDLSEPRNPANWKGLKLIVTRSWPREEFREGTAYSKALGWVFHIGFFAALVFSLPHILFFTDIFNGAFGLTFKKIFGFGWPHLPGGMIFFLAAITAAAMIAVLIHRFTNPVKKLISNFDDYFSWLVTFTPVATGLIAYSHVGGPYQTLLALHVLSVELLMVWFPFGKLIHTFTIFASRASQGMQFERKGASL
jgi:nitrate reductase gamma subunit